MTLAWVIGGHGLLGAALTRTLRGAGTPLFVPAQRFAWGDAAALAAQIEAAVHAFAQAGAASGRWEVYWAAGVGTMSSPADALAPETAALAQLLRQLGATAPLLDAGGTIAYSSSAGAIYAGARTEVITEHTPPAPTTAYAHAKLAQEALLSDFVAAHPGTRALLARISTLYGPGQASGKQQGLLGHIARCIIRNRPIQIYVPYDTIRDYIDADDAAAAMVAAVRAEGARPPVLVKIVASEYPATIAEIVSIFRRLARRTPLIVRSANRLSALYARRVQFRSVVATAGAAPPRRLPLGIARLMMAERAAYQGGPKA